MKTEDENCKDEGRSWISKDWYRVWANVLLSKGEGWAHFRDLGINGRDQDAVINLRDSQDL